MEPHTEYKGNKFVEIDVTTVSDLHDSHTMFTLRDAGTEMRIMHLHRMNMRGNRMIERAKLSAEALSHEMRAPLASIIMIVDSLLGEDAAHHKSQ